MLTNYATDELESMADVLAKAINKIKDRGYMDMTYDKCAIGTVQMAAGEFNQFSGHGYYYTKRAGPVLAMLDNLSEGKGTHPHGHHTGAHIEGYGLNANWDAKMMLRIFNEGLEMVQRELANRAVERELVPA